MEGRGAQIGLDLVWIWFGYSDAELSQSLIRISPQKLAAFPG